MRAIGFRAWVADGHPLPASLRAGWASIVATGLHGPGTVVAFLEIAHDAAPDEQILLKAAGRGRFVAVWFVNASARNVRMVAYGRLDDPARVVLHRPRRIGPATAAIRLVARRGALPQLIAGGPTGPAALKKRLRQVQAAVIADRRALSDYATWLACFATWSDADIAETADAPTIGLVVFGQDRASAALRATLASVPARTAFAVADRGTGWQTALGSLPAAVGYVGILQAGEILVPHALRLARALLCTPDRPAFAFADEDRLDAAGHRSKPSFRPQPNHVLMLSGTPARGLWLVRRDLVDALAGTAAEPLAWAELLRLELWLRHREAGGSGGLRLPHLLSSARPDTERAPHETLSALIDRHLARSGLMFRATPSWPVRLRLLPRQAEQPITAIVPSTLTAPHAARCLDAILSRTAHERLDLVVVVAQSRPLDPEQRSIAERLLTAHPNCRFVHLPTPSFNFAQAVNHGAVGATGDVLLLNDDVEPVTPDWLARMQAHGGDRRVGIVGARLLYPDGSIQHGGIVMGLAGFCEHAFRHLPADCPGYGSRAVLPQQVLAVTGACLLVRAPLWEQLGGMDESYPSAFNDVDLCLRAGEFGAEVVLSDATLIHHELQTYGSHYAGDRAAFHDNEVARMRRRWAAAIASDPFYSPNLDPFPGREWTPCYPPRLDAGGREPRLEPDPS